MREFVPDLLHLLNPSEISIIAIQQEVGWYDKEENSSGAIAGRLSTDTLSIRGAVGDQLGLIIQNLVTIIGAYVIAFSAGWKMTLVVTATVPLLAISAWTNHKFLTGFSVEVARASLYAQQCSGVHSLVYLMIKQCSVIHSARLLTRSPTHPFAHSPTHSPAHLFAHSLAHSLALSLTHPPTHRPTHPPTHSLTHSFTHPLAPSATCSFIVCTL